MPSGTRQHGRVAVVLLALAFATGCADASGSASDASRDLAAVWLKSTNGSQRPLLADLRISEEEYVEAVLSASRCVEEQGFGVSAVRDVADKVRKDFLVYLEGGDPQEANAALVECRWEHLESVESVYLAQHSRVDEGIDVLEQELISCLADNGVGSVPSGLTDFELFTLLRERVVSTAAWYCRDAFLIAIGKLGATPPH